MKKEADPGINFFQRYLTIWVFLCMVVGVLLGHFAPSSPCITGSAGICPCLYPDGYSDLGNDISHDAESGLQQCTKCRKKSEGVVCDMDCQLAYKTFYNVWHCQLVFLRDFQGIYYA